MESRGFKNVVIDLFRTSNLTEFTEKNITQIFKSYSTPMDKFRSILLKGLPKLAPKISFGLSGEPEIGLGVSTSKVTLDTLSDVLIWNDTHKKI